MLSTAMSGYEVYKEIVSVKIIFHLNIDIEQGEHSSKLQTNRDSARQQVIQTDRTFVVNHKRNEDFVGDTPQIRRNECLKV